MTKFRRSNREAKKQAALSLKEKRTAKQLKKHAEDPTPLIAKTS